MPTNTTTPKTFWTPRKTESLILWYERYSGKPNVYARVNKKVKASSPNAVYKKLGRLGMLKADWSKDYVKSRRK